MIAGLRYFDCRPLQLLVRLVALEEVNNHPREGAYFEFSHRYLIEFYDGFFSKPIVRVHEAKHTNPFDTLVTVLAPGLVLLIASITWALRAIHKMQRQDRLADEANKLLQEVTHAVARGDDKAVKVAAPIAKLLIDKIYGGNDTIQVRALGTEVNVAMKA